MSDLPPPSYQEAVASPAAGSSNRPNRNSLGVPSSPTHRRSNSAESSHIPLQRRASLEDGFRTLPEGWIREFDDKSQHHFYVNTNAKPPVSIWHHPYDDNDGVYKGPIPDDDPAARAKRGEPAHNDHTDLSDSDVPPANQSKAQGKKPEEKRTFGRKLKDKLTNSTHEQRVEKRRKEAEMEKKYMELLQIRQQAFNEANRTGKPVAFGKNERGETLYATPYNYRSGYSGGYGYGGGYGGGYAAPMGPYYRRDPYGYGYGGGGMGMGAPILGGLAGGLLLGGILGGF